MNYKIALSFVSGAAVGCTGTYFFVKKRFEKIANDEIAKAKKEYKDELAKLQKPCTDAVEAPKESKEAADGEKKKPAKKKSTPKSKVNVVAEDGAAFSEMEEIIDKQAYDTIYKKPKTGSKKSEKTADGPEIITFDEYVNDRRHTKVTITYLVKEDMFVDDNGEPVEDAETYVGRECLDIDFSEDGQSMYVRNDKFGVDYEVYIDTEHTFRSYLDEEGI